VIFDESNGSQGKQVDTVVGIEEPSSKAIKKLATGEIKPQEKDDDDELMFHGPSAAHPGCGRTNLNYTGSSTRVLSRGLPRASNSIIPWPKG
jgi:hypothetical protein